MTAIAAVKGDFRAKESPHEIQRDAACRKQAVSKLPCGVFVWLDEFEQAFRHDFPADAYRMIDKRSGKRNLIFAPPLADGEREMVLEGRFELSHPKEFVAAFHENTYNGRPIDWGYWMHQMPSLTPAHAARLMCGLDPHIFENLDSRPTKSDPTSLTERAKKIQTLAETQDIGSQTPIEWLDWADERGLLVPPQFRQIAKAKQAPSAPPTASLTPTAKAGLTRKAILSASWPVKGNFNLKNALSDVPKWLEEARVTPGVRGKGPKGAATWNPALIALCLADKNHADSRALSAFLKRYFQKWSEEWERHAENL